MKTTIYIQSALLATALLAVNIVFAQNNKGDEDKDMFNNAKARDQQAIDKAVKGWWAQSMKTHDQRIDWWHKAKFGMFIHWGVYSQAGGEWKGQKVSGYAEHLMRKEKISRAEYLELAHHFNPVLFNADTWVRNAREAGMNYLIITSKHHDGFAMYDSKVSDFNIMQQTPFKRDPMKELSAACKKYGVKFGFYYSHAFDWEHPDAPGNDWEYKNPGGDLNLYGGTNWFDVHPELLPKAVKYVNEKAIPQIKELLRNYHPDILWFDTPHKLPLSENIRILEAIRETDPNVVVNGRLARSGDMNFGDYKNTADRPAEFYPVTGDWEAIPTTNESYGYFKYDDSHKPAAFFIQLLAKAVSRGGNLLMNIGPRGDGEMDVKDVTILKGIGEWVAKNKASIYDVGPSSLPLQSWGVTTQKNNLVYLHVFNWPSDGRLQLGGLLNKIDKAYLLTDPAKQPLRIITGNRMTSIMVPPQAPDTSNTVIVLALKEKPKTDSVRFVASNTATRLLAFDAILKGKGFGFGDGKASGYYVDGWKSANQQIAWHFNLGESARFKIVVKYVATPETAGAYQLQLDQNKYEGKVQATEKGNVIQTIELGTADLIAGYHQLTIAPLALGKSELMRLLEVQLVPQNLAAIFTNAEAQSRLMIQEIAKANAGKPDLVSPRTLEHGNLKLVASRDWTSGFFPGVLWFLDAYTGKREWLQAAKQFTANIEKEKTNGTTHDMGFKVYCSFGTGYRITKDAHYKEVIVQAARTLARRFNATTGTLRSWDHSRDKWGFPVIIDNMMNLELLFEGAKLSGDTSLYRIAVAHANTTMKNHFRPDYSSYHVVDYDTLTGKVVKKTTHQGYANESAWARGQAWGLYGYTMCYRETKNKAYLDHAEHIAAFILHHPNLPQDKVPYWDFNAPGIPNEPRDASAAAVIASALYELSAYTKTNAKIYRVTADQILESLAGSQYTSPANENQGFILLHSTGAKPANSEVDVPLNYADYYYLEALLRGKNLQEGKPVLQLAK